MGYDLDGQQGETWFSVTSWPKLLEMALLNGWFPMGTEPPPFLDDEDLLEGTWEGGYLSNDGQWVVAEDAAGLAAALERALPDIPDHDALAVEEPGSAGHDDMVVTTDPPGGGRQPVDLCYECSVYEWFSGPGKKVVEEFVVFCRQGGFAIW